MIDWTLSDAVTGEILATGQAMTAEQANLQATGGGVITLVYSDPDTEQEDGGSIIGRPASPTTANKFSITADGVDFVRFSPCSATATVTIAIPPEKGLASIPADQVITGGLVDINTTIPGRYYVKISDFPYQDYTVAIDAV